MLRGLVWWELRCGPFAIAGAVTEKVAHYAFRWLEAHFERRARAPMNVIAVVDRERPH